MYGGSNLDFLEAEEIEEMEDNFRRQQNSIKVDSPEEESEEDKKTKSTESDYTPSDQTSPKKAKVAVEEVEAIDFTSLKATELRAECELRGLESKGVKAVLIARLEDFIANGDTCSGSAEQENQESSKEEEESGTVDFSSLKVVDLREECEKRGLDSKGIKVTLIKRLEKNA